MKNKYNFVAFVFFALFAGSLAKSFAVPEAERRGYYNYDEADGERTVVRPRHAKQLDHGRRTLREKEDENNHCLEFSAADNILDAAEKQSERIQLAKLEGNDDDSYVDDDGAAKVDGNDVDIDGIDYPPVEHSLSSMNNELKLRELVKGHNQPRGQWERNRSKNKLKDFDYNNQPNDEYEDQPQYGP